jgi:undecaprenyl-diphosphatase
MMSSENMHPPRHERVHPVVYFFIFSLLLVAVYLASELIEKDSFAFDRTILLALRRPDLPAMPIGPLWLEQSAIDISALGGFTLISLICLSGAALLLAFGRRSAAAWIAFVAISSSLLEGGLKLWLHRARPELVPHLATVTSLSFPSGHATMSAAVYLTLAIMIGEEYPKLRRYCVGYAVLLVMLIGASRVYLGVHWPSDVIAGWCIGSSMALLSFAGRNFVRN